MQEKVKLQNEKCSVKRSSLKRDLLVSTDIRSAPVRWKGQCKVWGSGFRSLCCLSDSDMLPYSWCSVSLVLQFIRGQFEETVCIWMLLYSFILWNVLLKFKSNLSLPCAVSLFFFLHNSTSAVFCKKVSQFLVMFSFDPAPFIFNMGSAVKFRSLSIPNHTVTGRNPKARRRTRTAASRRGKHWH